MIFALRRKEEQRGGDKELPGEPPRQGAGTVLLGHRTEREGVSGWFGWMDGGPSKLGRGPSPEHSCFDRRAFVPWPQLDFLPHQIPTPPQGRVFSCAVPSAWGAMLLSLPLPLLSIPTLPILPAKALLCLPQGAFLPRCSPSITWCP